MWFKNSWVVFHQAKLQTSETSETVQDSHKMSQIMEDENTKITFSIWLRPERWCRATWTCRSHTFSTRQRLHWSLHLWLHISQIPTTKLLPGWTPTGWIEWSLGKALLTFPMPKSYHASTHVGTLNIKHSNLLQRQAAQVHFSCSKRARSITFLILFNLDSNLKMHYDRIAACPVSVPPQSLKSKQESPSAFSGTSAMKPTAQERLGKARRKRWMSQIHIHGCFIEL